MRCVFLMVTLGLALGGCAKGTGSSNPFGASGYVPSGDDTTDGEDTDGDTEDDEGTGDASSISDGSAGSTGDDGGSTSTTGAVSTTTDDSAGSTGDDTADPSTTGDTGSGQPATGMWAHCSDGMSASCINGATTCIYIDDPQMPDGYCSTSGCQMPAVDCDPVPTDATSPATCINAKDTNDNDVPICALDCGLAQTCPAGMVCTGITFDGGTTNYDICV